MNKSFFRNLLWLCLTVTASTVVAQPGSPTQDVARSGLLYGVLDTGSRQFRFLIEVSQTDEGSQTAELKSLDEGGRRFSLDNFRYSDLALEFEIKISAAAYQGQFDPSKQAFVGSWKQRTADLGLEFRPLKAIPKPEYAAVWRGQLSVLTQKLDVQFRELKDGEVFFDSLTQLAGGFVAKKETDGKQVKFVVSGIPGGAEFSGVLSDDGQTITGTWKQGLFPIKLVLHRQNDVLEESDNEAPEVTVMKRPQTPIAPFPYEITEVKFPNEAAGLFLAGTLTLPAGEGPFPAVVLISGSGPQDRDETIFEHKPFWVMADHWARHGIATLRFDDRGVGQSEGEFSQATSEDFATDVVAAVNFLRSQEKIDAQKIGLCGHSEGGIIAPIVAAADPDLGFVILLAGPGVNGARILASQARLILEASGAASDAVERQAEVQALLLELAQRTPPLSAEEFVAQSKQELASLVEDGQLSQESIDALATSAATQLTSPWFRYFLTYEPAQALRQLRCPVLAVIGEKDLQVEPKLNVPALRSALEAAPTTDFTVQEIPGVNHLFQRCNTGLVSEYAEIEETVSPDVLQLISQWILERTQK